MMSTDMPKMNDLEHSLLKRIAKRLEELIPILKENIPSGWTDFRDPMEPEWCMGLFFDTSQSTDLALKVMYGCKARANLAASDFERATGYRAEIVKEEHFWVVKMTVPDVPGAVCW